MKGNVYLVGLPGSGKTSAGRALARLLDVPFVDLDREVTGGAGASIQRIFERGGEAEFRALESAALAEAAAGPPAVVACGGGVVVRPENRALLRRTGTVVYLSATVERLVAGSVVGSRNRPLLRTEEDLERLAREREPLYREVAHHEVGGTGKPDQVAGRILEALA